MPSVKATAHMVSIQGAAGGTWPMTKTAADAFLDAFDKWLKAPTAANRSYRFTSAAAGRIAEIVCVDMSAVTRISVTVDAQIIPGSPGTRTTKPSAAKRPA